MIEVQINRTLITSRDNTELQQWNHVANVIKTPPNDYCLEQQSEPNEMALNGSKNQVQCLDPNNNCARMKEICKVLSKVQIQLKRNDCI